MKLCPRCGLKVIESADECPDCHLNFARLALATNADAKRKIKRHDREFILRTHDLPSDVSYKKLLLLTIFLGMFGAHCFYVGRYLRGGMFVLNMVFAAICVIFNQQILAVDEGRLIELFGIIIGAILLCWIYDFIMVAIKRFKVPIAIDLKDDGEKKK